MGLFVFVFNYMWRDATRDAWSRDLIAIVVCHLFAGVRGDTWLGDDMI